MRSRLQLLGQARPFALDPGGVAGLHGPTQTRIGAQSDGLEPGVAPVVVDAGNAEPAPKSVELLGVDRINNKAAF